MRLDETRGREREREERRCKRQETRETRDQRERKRVRGKVECLLGPIFDAVKYEACDLKKIIINDKTENRMRRSTRESGTGGEREKRANAHTSALRAPKVSLRNFSDGCACNAKSAYPLSRTPMDQIPCAKCEANKRQSILAICEWTGGEKYRLF